MHIPQEAVIAFVVTVLLTYRFGAEPAYFWWENRQRQQKKRNPTTRFVNSLWYPEDAIEEHWTNSQEAGRRSLFPELLMDDFLSPELRVHVEDFLQASKTSVRPSMGLTLSKEPIDFEDPRIVGHRPTSRNGRTTP